MNLHKQLEAKGTHIEPISAPTIKTVDNSDLLNALRNEIELLKKQMADL